MIVLLCMPHAHLPHLNLIMRNSEQLLLNLFGMPICSVVTRQLMIGERV